MRVNQEAIDIIKHFEGYSSTVYEDPIGIPTIGYGSIWDKEGNRLTMEHRPITEPEAEYLLVRELRHVEKAVTKLIVVPLTVNQFSAIGSLTYNIGSSRLKSSTLRSKINREDYNENEFIHEKELDKFTDLIQNVPETGGGGIMDAMMSQYQTPEGKAFFEDPTMGLLGFLFGTRPSSNMFKAALKSNPIIRGSVGQMYPSAAGLGLYVPKARLGKFRYGLSPTPRAITQGLILADTEE